MSEFDKFLQKSGLTFEEYKSWFSNLQIEDEVLRNNRSECSTRKVKEVFSSSQSIMLDGEDKYSIKEKQVFYSFDGEICLATAFPVPNPEQIREIIKKRPEKEEVFDLKPGQKYETKDGRIFVVKRRKEDSDLWYCSDVSFVLGYLWTYSATGKLDPRAGWGSGLDFVKLISDSSENEQLEVSKNETKEEKEESKAKEILELKKEIESLKAQKNYNDSALVKYEEACVENYELRKIIEDLQARLANSKSSEARAQADLNKTLDDFEKLEERIFILKQSEQNLLDSLNNKTEIINQLQRNARGFDEEALLWTNEKMALEDHIRELTSKNIVLENKLSSIEQLFKSV